MDSYLVLLLLASVYSYWYLSTCCHDQRGKCHSLLPCTWVQSHARCLYLGAARGYGVVKAQGGLSGYATPPFLAENSWQKFLESSVRTLDSVFRFMQRAWCRPSKWPEKTFICVLYSFGTKNFPLSTCCELQFSIGCIDLHFIHEFNLSFCVFLSLYRFIRIMYQTYCRKSKRVVRIHEPCWVYLELPLSHCGLKPNLTNCLEWCLWLSADSSLTHQRCVEIVLTR